MGPLLITINHYNFNFFFSKYTFPKRNIKYKYFPGSAMNITYYIVTV